MTTEGKIEEKKEIVNDNASVEQQNPLLQIANVLNNHNQRINLLEIDAKRANASIDILQKYIRLLEKRIDLLEKEQGE